jgi:hypothetical protein
MVGALGAAGLGAAVSNILEQGDKIHKLSLRLGVSTEALSQLGHAADLSGVSFGALSAGLQRMTRRVAEAAQGTGAAKGALEELGLDAAELNKMEPETAFKKIAEAMSKVESQSDKVRLAMKIFDTEGVSLIQMMGEGATGLNKMMQEADRLGVTLSDTAAQDIADFNDAMTRIQALTGGVAREILMGALPQIEEMVMAFTDWWQVNEDLIGQKVHKVFEHIKITAEQTWPAIQTVGQWIFWLVDRMAFLAAKALDLRDKLWSFDQSKLGGALFGENPHEWANPQGMLQSKSPLTGAAAVAAAGGGDTSLTETEKWAQGQGVTVVNNFNSQVTRSDAVAIATEADRLNNRK